MKAIETERAKALKEILTSEQWTQYESSRKALRDKTMAQNVYLEPNQTDNMVPVFANRGFSAAGT